MNKAFGIARNEFLTSVRSKAFIVGVLAAPLFMGAALVMNALAANSGDMSDRRFAVIDHTGELWPAIEKAASFRNANLSSTETEEGGNEKKPAPRFVPVLVPIDANPVDLSDKVRKGELFAYLVIGDAVIRNGDASSAPADVSIAYHTDTPTYNSLPRWIRETISEEVRRIRFESAGLDQRLVNQLSAPTLYRQLGLVHADIDTGKTTEAEERNELQLYAVPGGAMFLMFMLIMVSCPQLLNTVLEEKIARVAELLISSVTPFQLMLGKLMGAVMVTMTLAVLYLAVIIVLLNHFDIAGIVPIKMYFWLLFFLLLGVIMYGSIFVAIGAACTEIRDAQSLMMPAMLVVMLPLFCWMPILQSPDSSFSVGASMIPLATPMIMLLRIGMPPGPPAWQIILSVVLSIGTALLCVKVAAKIFRIGILSYGQAPTIRNLMGWVFSK